MADAQTIAEHDLSDEEIMAKYKISCVPTDRFHYKSFRFSRLADALAHAKRDEANSAKKAR